MYVGTTLVLHINILIAEFKFDKERWRDGLSVQYYVDVPETPVKVTLYMTLV